MEKYLKLMKIMDNQTREATKFTLFRKEKK